MTNRSFIDTNVWVYAVDRSDIAKQNHHPRDRTRGFHGSAGAWSHVRPLYACLEALGDGTRVAAEQSFMTTSQHIHEPLKLGLPVRVSKASYAYHEHDQSIVVDLVQNSVIPDAEAPDPLVAGAR